MAYCATITIHDNNGEGLHTLRFGCMPDGDPNLLCANMANQVCRLIERRPGLKIKLLADGAHEMWNLLESHFTPDYSIADPHPDGVKIGSQNVKLFLRGP